MSLVERRKLRVLYRSVNSRDDQWRQLVPAGLAWDGQRWHVRAWFGMREEWRDFVLGRISAADWPIEPAGDLLEDTAWTTFEIVKLRLNPELSPEWRKGLCIDYGLAGETPELRVRSSMKPYLLAAMFIEHEIQRDLPRHFALE